MPRFGVQIGGGSFYTFRYSPLGFPSQNLEYVGRLGTRADDPGHTVRLFRSADGEWECMPWPPSLWWLRLVLTLWALTRGTRWEDWGGSERPKLFCAIGWNTLRWRFAMRSARTLTRSLSPRRCNGDIPRCGDRPNGLRDCFVGFVENARNLSTHWSPSGVRTTRPCSTVDSDHSWY